MGKNQDSAGQGWGASFLTQTTEDVARAVVAAAASVRPRPSVVFSTKYQNSNNQLQKLQRQVSKVWKGCPFPGDGKKAAYNPEVLTGQKRQWTRLQLQALDRKHQKEPSNLFENIVVVGLHPNTDVQAIEASLMRKRALDKEIEGSERFRDVLRHQHRGIYQPNLEPQVLFAYPPKKRLPLKYKDLLSFCFPGGLEAHLVERTPSMSEFNEIILGQELLNRNDLSFVFRLKVADNATLYGCCMVIEELVQKAPGLMPVHADVPLFHSSLGRFLVSAPRCYCILSKMPFFNLHFGVLKSIFTQERLERITASINELNVVPGGSEREAKYESHGLVKSQVDHAAEAAKHEGPLVKKTCAEDFENIEGAGSEHEKCSTGHATENRVLTLSSEPNEMKRGNGEDQLLQVKYEAAMHDIKGTSPECSETSGETGFQRDKCSMGGATESKALFLPSETKGMKQENVDDPLQFKFGSECSEQVCNKDSKEPQEEISKSKVLECSVRNGEVISSNFQGEISPFDRHGQFEHSDSSSSIQVFSNNNFEGHFRSMNLDDEVYTEEASPSGQEDTNASDAILAWAKANNRDSLRIVCEYYRLPFPSRGSSLVFQPLEHLQPLTFHRSGDMDLKSAIDFSSCKTRLEIAEARATLFAEEEAGALAVWTIATVCGVLPLDSVLAMLSAVLLEKQIVVVCSNLGVLSAAVLSVIPLIRPFQWQSLLLPVLPNSMLEFLDAPVPYVVGVKNKSAEVRTKLPNIVLVDVNKNQVRMSSVPQLPQHKELLSALGPYHTKLVAESYLAKKRPVHEYNDAQAQAVEGFLGVLRSYLESICTNLRAHTITNVQSNDDKAVLAVDNRENVGMAILSYLEMATQADRDVLQRCGLYKALRTPQYTSDQRLIVDIVSHWDRRRHVFHLPQVGDVMVTPRDIRRILGVPATGMPVRLGTLPSTEAAHREAAQFFTGAGRWDRRGAPLQTVLLSGIPRVRKMIILCILFRISRKQNYREVPGGWMDAVRRCEAGERMDWAALIAANLVAQLDTIRTSGRGGLSYSTLLQCWFFDHFAAVAPAGGPHPITEGAPMVHRWQTRLRGTEDRAHVRRSVEATSLDLLTLPDYTAEPYRTVRWGSDDEAGGAGAPAGDDSSDGGDDGDSGDSGADPSRPAETAGPSGTAGQAEGPSGAAEGEAGPFGAQGDVRGPVTRARRLRIVMGSAGARAGAIPTERGTQAAEEVPEDEAPAAGGEPEGEDAVQPEDQAATAGTAEIRRLVEAVVREMFPQVYAEGQPPIQAGDEPRTAGAHREAFAPLVRARDMWAAESQEHATSLGQLQQERDGARRERDDARRERDDARRERDELRGRAQAQEAQGGAGGDSESRTQLIIITERLRVTEEALRGERDRIQARYDQLVAQMVSRSRRSRTHTHTAATTPRRPRDEGSEAGSSRRTRRSLGGVWSPGEGSQRPGESAPGAGPQQ